MSMSDSISDLSSLRQVIFSITFHRLKLGGEKKIVVIKYTQRDILGPRLDISNYLYLRYLYVAESRIVNLKMKMAS